MESELILIGLFRHLVDRGFPLGLRDYRDALFALENGAGTLDRDRLLWLCRTLWARTDEEATWLERLFREFPKPSDAELEPWLPPEPASGAPVTPVSPGIATPVNAPTIQDVPELRFQATGQTGTALPRAMLAPGVEEPFIYTPWPLVTLRSLIICWRRFRRAQRGAGRTADVDVNATVLEKCRTGFLRAPAFTASRENQARVLVLVDASASMSPWAGFFRTLEESLAESRLRWSRVLYFENVPSGELYESESFLGPVEVQALLRENSVTPLLVVSDAGAARGHRNRKRVEATRQFLSEVSVGWHSVAWVNPMPRARWAGTSAEQIARFPQLPMLELNEEGMLAAVDTLRGLRDGA